ncbi:hypothetical protein Pmani_029434, partial [Petrolisthes manimaculis]
MDGKGEWAVMEGKGEGKGEGKEGTLGSKTVPGKVGKRDWTDKNKEEDRQGVCVRDEDNQLWEKQAVLRSFYIKNIDYLTQQEQEPGTAVEADGSSLAAD